MIYSAILDATFRRSHVSYPVLFAPENVWYVLAIVALAVIVAWLLRSQRQSRR
jgi:hypothetical protein